MTSLRRPKIAEVLMCFCTTCRSSEGGLGALQELLKDCACLLSEPALTWHRWSEVCPKFKGIVQPVPLVSHNRWLDIMTKTCRRLVQPLWVVLWRCWLAWTSDSVGICLQEPITLVKAGCAGCSWSPFGMQCSFISIMNDHILWVARHIHLLQLSNQIETISNRCKLVGTWAALTVHKS